MSTNTEEKMMEEPRTTPATEDRVRQAEDTLEELYQLAGSVAAVFDSYTPEDRATMECFEKVLDALEDRAN